MKRKRFTEEQIIGVLKEHEAGASVPDLSRRHGVAENTIYRWKAKFGGMEVSEAKRLRDLEVLHERAHLPAELLRERHRLRVLPVPRAPQRLHLALGCISRSRLF